MNRNLGATQVQTVVDMGYRITFKVLLQIRHGSSEICKPLRQVRSRLGWSAGISVALGMIGAIAPLPATAQITPDTTLGNEGSRVTRNVTVRGGTADRIDGGAARGANLFHSFLEFNVNDGQRVYFANPAGVANILSRVTGTDVSDLMGTLGVEGSANLFLLNPNGIIFGPNAQLDVSGSFTASTADSIAFPDGGEFSATNPGDPSLLSVAVPLGVQYGATPPGAITNAGNLTVGQNLSLSGGSVTSTGQLSAPLGQLWVEGVAGDVQVRQAIAQTATVSASNNLILQESQLQTAGDLNLLAGNTVQIRDSVTNPFVAYAGGDLTVQGNQAIDIFALNHPSSGLVSGGDMVLRSANTVGGDAHYWTGGSFRIEQLDGNLGNLFSPYDPVIRSSGDVSLNAYSGASLHIIAGGSVTISGFVWIQRGDPNGLVEPVPLTGSDGHLTLFDIDGRTPTLDIRAGTTAFGTPGILGITPTDLFAPVPGIDGTPIVSTVRTSANIQVGTIYFAATDNDPATGDTPLRGTVLLTNQYRPNPNLDGDIQLTATAGPLFSNVVVLNGDENGGGNLNLYSRRNITINGIVRVYGQDDIFMGDPLVGTVGGDVTLRAVGNINLLPGTEIDSTSINSDFTRNFSTVRLESTNGSVFLNQASITAQNSGTAFPGDIVINARDEISIANSSTISSEGNFGRIFVGDSSTGISPRTIVFNNSTLSTQNVVTDDSGVVVSRVDPGTQVDAGDIRVQATNGISLLNGTQLNSITSRRGNGGNITITTGTLEVRNGAQILARNIGGVGNAGSVTIVARDTVTISEGGNPTVATDVAGSGTGNGNDLTIRAREININNNSIVAASILSGQGLNGVAAQAGNITIAATDRVSISDNSVVFSEIGSGSFGNGGTIRISAPNIFLDGSSVNTQIQLGGRGRAGDIVISAPQLLQVTNGGQLSTITRGQGNAGTVTISGQNVIFAGEGNNRWSRNSYITGVLLDRSGVFASVELGAEDNAESGVVSNAGNITINTPQLTLQNRAIVSAQTLGSGQGGSIFLSPNLNGRSLTVNLSNNSQISASTFSTGSGGDMLITAPDSVTLTGRGLLTVQSNPRATGGAGNLSIATERLTVNGGTQVSARTLGSGQGGSILLSPNLNGRSLIVNLDENSEISASTSGSGRGGSMEITAPDSVALRGGGRLTVETTGTAQAGQAGNLRIETRRLAVNGGTRVSAAATGTGAAGNLIIDARQVTVRNNASISASNRSFRFDDNDPNRFRYGNVRLRELDTLVVNSGGEITASTQTGRAGNVEVNADDSVEISGNGRLAVEATRGMGRAGNLTINTNQLNINNGEVTASTRRGRAGDLTINADQLRINNGEVTASTRRGRAGNVEVNADDSVEINGENSRLAVRATGNGGRAGNLTITTDDLTIQDGAEATVSSRGVAGNLTINADFIELNNGSLTAIAGDGNQANITINMSGTLFRFYNRSLISAGATGQGSGGDATINARNGFVLANPYGDSDILADAFEGVGGDINITTNAIFGLEERNPVTALSDINAASQFNASGSITLNTLNVDPTRGLGELPVDIVNTADLVADGCVGRNRAGVTDQGEFTRTGRGGLSPNPGDPLTSAPTTDSLATLDPSETPSDSASIPEVPEVQPLIEAQGLGLNAEGKVSLVSGVSGSSTTTTPIPEQSSVCTIPAT